MATKPENNPALKIPLRLILIVPFAVQIALATALIGYLSFLNGRRAVNDVAHQLRNEITARIEEHLLNFLAVPHRINRLNANALRQGTLDANDPAAWERYLWEQIQVFDSVTSIYFGNTAGGLVDAGREGAAGSLYVIVTDAFAQGPFRKYATDAQGQPTELLATVPNFDARTRPWYKGAVAKGDSTWNDIYILFTGQDMAIAASCPVYDEQQNLLGVVSTDIFLSHLSNFLQSLKMGETGQSFIMERSGLLVATSTGEQPFVIVEGSAPRRLDARESATPLVRSAAEFLSAHFGDYHNITTVQQLEFEMAGQRQFLQVAPVQDPYGIEWLVVVVIPESDFMAQINANNRVTAGLILAIILLVVVTAGFMITRWVLRPILRLKTAAQALAAGEWQPVSAGGWVDEVDALTHSFNDMAAQLKQTLGSLTAEIAERKRVELILQESEERQRRVIQSMPVLLDAFDAAGTLIAWNQECERVTGYRAEEVVGNPQSMSRLYPDETYLQQVMATWRETGNNFRNWELTLTCKDGETRVVSWSNTSQQFPVPGWDSWAVGVDVTERVRAEAALRESNRRLERALAELQAMQERMMQQERLAAVGQLAAGIAHDFNNILATITLYTQLALRANVLTPELRKRLETVAQQAQHGADLVQQILDFGRQAMMKRQPLAMDLFLQGVVQMLERTLPESIQLRLVFEPNEYGVNADPARLQQAMVNLALNARDAMPKGGTLTFTLARVEGQEIDCVACGRVTGGAWVQVRITDSGMGIPPEVLPHIFEPFFTTRAPLGHGLGLAQVYGIVKQHEGHLAVETGDGRGTTFVLYLPALPVRAPVADTPAPIVAVTSGQGQTILVVEDDAAVRTALVEVLELLGYQTLAAAEGQAALELCARRPEIALVLCDWVMPSMGGQDFVRALRERQLAVKVLVLTGHPLEDAVTQSATSMGIVGWILKPASLEQLAETIAQALE